MRTVGKKLFRLLQTILRCKPFPYNFQKLYISVCYENRFIHSFIRHTKTFSIWGYFGMLNYGIQSLDFSVVAYVKSE